MSIINSIVLKAAHVTKEEFTEGNSCTLASCSGCEGAVLCGAAKG